MVPEARLELARLERRGILNTITKPIETITYQYFKHLQKQIIANKSKYQTEPPANRH